MKLLKHFILLFVIILQYFTVISNGQNMLDLSYSSGDIHAPNSFGQNPYARPVPTTSTTAAPTTTKKSGFFSGIRNYFRGDKSTTPTPDVSTTPPTQPPRAAVRPNVSPSAPTSSSSMTSNTPTSPPVPQRGSINQPPQIPPKPVTPIIQPAVQPTPRPGQLPSTGMSQTPAAGQPQPQQPRPASPSRPSVPAPGSPGQQPNPWGQPASTPNTQNRNDFPPISPNAGKTPTREEFPALPSRPSSPATGPGTSTNSAWGTPRPSTPSSPGVQFVPHQPAPTPRPSSPTPSHPGSSNTHHRPATPNRGGSGGTTSESSGPELATDSEITTLTEALLTKDTNNPSRYVTMNIQGRTQSSVLTDEAPNPLLTVDEDAVFAIPTISKMRDLYNNYEIDTGVNEHVTPNEHREENDFVDAIMATSVMRYAMQFLQGKGLVTPDPKTHRDLVKTIWFNMYSRGGGKIGSSAFEHIFLTEIKNQTLQGLHNWIYFYEQEKAGKIDYKGYIKKVDIGTKGSLIKLRFTYNNINKPVNSMFIGTSPELEMAIYTVCFALRPDKNCPISLSSKTFQMTTHTFRYRGKNLIGSAYAEL